MSSNNFKECRKHGWLPESGFYKLNQKGRKEPSLRCKLCVKEYRDSDAGKKNRNRLRREWAKKHPKKERMMARVKKEKNPEKYKLASKRSRQKLRLEVLQHYSGSDIPICDCCGEARLEFLALDHKNGGGNKHRKEILKAKKVTYTAVNMYRWARANNYPPLFRVLCCNCNHSYGQYGYCPHQKEHGNGSM